MYRSRKCCCSNLNICGQSYIVVVVRAKEEKYIHHHMNKVINIFNKHHVSISFTSASSNKMVDIWSPIGFYFQRIHSVQASIFSIRSRSNKAQNWLDCVPIVPHFTFHCIEIFLHDFRPDVSWSLINRRCFFNGLNSNKFASWKNNKVLNLPFVVLQNGKLRFAHSMHEAYVVLYQHAHFILSLSEQTKKNTKTKTMHSLYAQ